MDTKVFGGGKKKPMILCKGWTALRRWAQKSSRKKKETPLGLKKAARPKGGGKRGGGDQGRKKGVMAAGRARTMKQGGEVPESTRL